MVRTGVDWNLEIFAGFLLLGLFPCLWKLGRVILVTNLFSFCLIFCRSSFLFLSEGVVLSREQNKWGRGSSPPFKADRAGFTFQQNLDSQMPWPTCSQLQFPASHQLRRESGPKERRGWPAEETPSRPSSPPGLLQQANHQSKHFEGFLREVCSTGHEFASVRSRP